MKFLIILVATFFLIISYGLTYLLFWFLIAQVNPLLWSLFAKIVFLIVGWYVNKIIINIVTEL